MLFANLSRQLRVAKAIIRITKIVYFTCNCGFRHGKSIAVYLENQHNLKNRFDPLARLANTRFTFVLTGMHDDCFTRCFTGS